MKTFLGVLAVWICINLIAVGAGSAEASNELMSGNLWCPPRTRPIPIWFGVAFPLTAMSVSMEEVSRRCYWAQTSTISESGATKQ